MTPLNALVRAVPGSPGVAPLVRHLNATLGDWYPGFRAADVFPAWSELSTIVDDVPPLDAFTMWFDNEADMRDYIRSPAYATNAQHPKVVAPEPPCSRHETS